MRLDLNLINFSQDYCSVIKSAVVEWPQTASFDLFEAYSTMRGWTNEAKIVQFSTSRPLPTVRGWTDEVKIIQFSTSGPLPTVRG